MFPSNIILNDLRECFKNNHVWLLLAFYDIKTRYRRTVIGPFWLTLGTAITILGMGLVWGSIFGTSLKEFLPYVATGMVIWIFIASVLNEGCSVFISQSMIIRNVRVSYFTHVMTMISRNLIIMIHNAIVIIAIFILCNKNIHFEILWVFPGIILLILNGFWVSIFLGILSTRYRDITPIVTNLLTLIMMATPIMWKADMIQGSRRAIVNFNPFAHMISIVRAPLLGESPSFESYLVVIGILLVGLPISLSLYKKYINRIVFWM